MKENILLLILLPVVFVYSQTKPDYEKLAKACELWGSIKYFHPSKPTSRFDSMFAAQVPRMLKANDDSEWRELIADWLKVLNDPATQVVRKAILPEGESKAYFTTDSLLIVRIHGSKFFEEFPGSRDFLRKTIELSKKSKGIIFDLRQEVEIPSKYDHYMSVLFNFSGVDRNLGTHVIPKYKSISYSGFKAEKRASNYSVNEILENSLSEPESPLSEIKSNVAWIVNKFSQLPVVALSEQSSGKGFIISETESIDYMLPLTNTFQFSDNLDIRYRAKDILLPTAVKSDYKYAASDDPVEKAKEFLLKGKKIKNPLFVPNIFSNNENPNFYPSQIYPTIGYRVLAAAKIFTVIQKFFPYHQYMDKDWKVVFKESLPDIVNAHDEIEYGLAVAKMYANIQDSHGFMTGNKGLGLISGEAPSPMAVDWIENKVVVTKLRNDSICKSNRISVGDIVLKVDGVPTEELMKKYPLYYAHSTKQDIDQISAQYSIRGPHGKEGTFTILDGKGKTRDIKLPWNRSFNNFATKYPLDTLVLLNGNIGYADLTRMVRGQTDKMFEKFKNTKAIVFDMRGYPNSTAWSIAPRLMEKQNIPLALFRRPEVVDSRTSYLMQRRYSEFITTFQPSDKWKYKGKTVMLINQNAISQAEYTGQLFESANNTTFVGSPTVGANGDVTNFEVPGGIILTFTGQGVWHADGRQLQRVGLQPHVPVKPTIKGIRLGKDEVLEKATDWINKSVN